MVKVDLKGLYKAFSKGKTYYYAWRGGPRLPDEPGTPEFLQAFQDARNPLCGGDHKTFGAWITRYKASDNWKDLAESTKRSWAPWLDRAREEFGALSIRQFDRPKIRIDITRWRNQWREQPRAADFGKQVLSRVLSFCVAEGAIATNPCIGIPNLYSADRSDLIWTAQDLKILAAHASKEVMWAARLAALSGLRQGDLMRLSWSHISANAIEIKTGKSGGKRVALIPLYGDLGDVLKEIKSANRPSTLVLTNSRGKPWKSFGTSWNGAMHASGLNETDLHFHDLRGTAATNFYKAEFTVREIAEILGWSEEKVQRIIDRYVKRDEILRDRIARMDRAGGRLDSAK